MRDAQINAWVDLIAFIFAMAAIVTGYILWFYFPFGAGRGSMELLNISYQTWYVFHFVTSTLLVISIAIHLILHYRWIRKLRPLLMSKK